MRIPRTLSAVVVVTTLGGCQARSTDRIDHPDDHLSLEAIDGWTQARERGFLLFSDPDSRATIALRSGEFGKRTPADLAAIAASTKTVLASLPSSEVEGPIPLDHEQMTAVLFEVAFVPPDRTETYARRHAVLVGQRRFYHAVLTAPEDELAIATELFSQTVSSLREE